jgi:hypothetical protein
MEKLTKEWEELKSFLPEGWEEKAKESKAICRTRKSRQRGGVAAGGTAAFW